MELPGDATASSVRADPDTWLVGAVPGRGVGGDRQALRRAHIGSRDSAATRSRAAGRARSPTRCAGASLLVYAQANVLRKPLQAVPDDPLSGPPNDWRATVAAPALTPPPVTPQSPLIALVDAAADLTHPEWTGDPNIATLPGTPVDQLARHRDRLGGRRRRRTGSASSASGRARGRSTSRSRPCRAPTARSPATPPARRSPRPWPDGASVINMSYGSPSRCAAEWVQIYFAVAKGIIPVAAAGNEFESGNPLEFPASLPHVVTVAATTPRRQERARSPTPTTRSTSARPASDILDRGPAGARRRRRPGRLPGAATARASARRWSPPRWRGSAPRGPS